jgi:hypothetical protein
MFVVRGGDHKLSSGVLVLGQRRGAAGASGERRSVGAGEGDDDGGGAWQREARMEEDTVSRWGGGLRNLFRCSAVAGCIPRLNPSAAELRRRQGQVMADTVTTRLDPLRERRQLDLLYLEWINEELYGKPSCPLLPEPGGGVGGVATETSMVTMESAISVLMR